MRPPSPPKDSPRSAAPEPSAVTARLGLTRTREVLPIWLHPFDGDFIAMRLVRLWSVRPMPHALIACLLQIAQLRLEKVAVTGLREDTFYGSLWIRAGGAVHEIDARPSDAIALALDSGAPIFVSEETLRQTGARCSAPDASYRS